MDIFIEGLLVWKKISTLLQDGFHLIAMVNKNMDKVTVMHIRKKYLLKKSVKK